MKDCKFTNMITLKEYQKMIYVIEYLHRGLLLKFIPIYLIFAVLFFLSFFYYKNFSASVFTIFIALLAPLFIYIRFKQSVNRDYYEYIDPFRDYSFNEQGMEVAIFGTKTFMPWEDFSQYLIICEMLVLYINEFAYFIIPLSSLDKDTNEKLFYFLNVSFDEDGIENHDRNEYHMEKD